MSSTTAVATRPSSGTLYDVIDLILDKGLVIDAFVRVSLVGIELLTIDARVVVASVDTYLHFAEAANRLDLSSGKGKGDGLSNLTGAVGGATGNAVEGGSERLQQTSRLAESAKEPAGGVAQSAQQTAGGAAQSAKDTAGGATQG